MSRHINPVSQLQNGQFLFLYRRETKEGSCEIVNAHQGIELVFVQEGVGQVMLEGKGYAISPGTLVICQPFQLHHYKMESRYVRTPLVFDPYAFERYVAPFPSLQVFFQKIWKGKLEQQLFSLSQEEQVVFERLFNKFHKRLQGISEFVRQEELGLFLISLFGELRSLYAGLDRQGGDKPEMREGRHIEQMMSWIEKHYHEEFSLDRLAHSLHLSPFYASHLFREETGCTLSQYIMARRIREACLLLTMTDNSIAEIGQMTGFNSSAYFCRLFKKKMGDSPQAFRKQLV